MKFTFSEKNLNNSNNSNNNSKSNNNSDIIQNTITPNASPNPSENKPPDQSTGGRKGETALTVGDHDHMIERDQAIEE